VNREELLKNAKPILFNTEMVQAILEGRKTVTRRLVKPKYKKDEGGFQVCTNKATGERWIEKHDWDEGSFDNPRYVNPPYQVGDILYVRETWNYSPNWYYCYKADAIPDDNHGYIGSIPWRPSIHMPKEAARIFLKVTDIRVERLQDITEEQAEKEGVKAYGQNNCSGTSARIAFAELWDSISETKFEWRANPWVWVIEFERVEVENERKNN
jgi:hypothetical protein